MEKEELIKFLEILNIEEIKALEIEYYTEKPDGFGNRETTTIKINKEY